MALRSSICDELCRNFADFLLSNSCDMHGFVYNQASVRKYFAVSFYGGIFLATVLFYWAEKLFISFYPPEKFVRFGRLVILLVRTIIVLYFSSIALQLISRNQVSLKIDQAGALIAILVVIAIEFLE
jgi:hypothetical protein